MSNRNRALGVRIDQRRAAGGRQRRLGFPVDDFELEADLLGNASAEFSAVCRGAASLGRDQPRPRDAAIAHLVAADGERLDRAPDRRVADAAGCRRRPRPAG